jgi:methyl-accepting chemotaxis protein
MKWLRNLKISAKLILAYMVMALIAGVVGIVAILNIREMNRNDAALYGIHTQGISYNAYAESYFQKARFDALKMTVTQDNMTREQCIANVNEYIEKAGQYLALFEKTIDNEELQGIYNKVRSSWDMYCTFLKSALRLAKDGDPGQAQNLLLSFASQTAAELQSNYDALTAYNIEKAKEASDSNVRAAGDSILIMVLIVGAAVITAVLMGLMIARLISRPVREMAKCAILLARGETDIGHIRYTSQDEIGQMAESFGEVLRAIRALITDTEELVQHAVAGDLSVRADADKHQGDYRKIVGGINQTLDAIVAPIQESTRVLEEMARGNLSVSVEGVYQGDHAIIKDALNGTISNLKRYIYEISEVLGQVAQGNLTVAIDSEYMGDFAALKDSINDIIASLNEIMEEINASADQVASGTRQVSGGSQDISQGAAEQANAIEELTASITQIAEQTLQNAQSANEANELTSGAKHDAEQGNERMRMMQQAMAEINESSENIRKIIKVIDDIAFQTNILALNAAVEAARAGVHGKGFAVVAEEVRNLAARSASAAKETTELIENSIKKTGAGTKITNETAEALKSIVRAVDTAAQLVGEIAAASNEQASAIAQVNRGIEQMSEVVQTNSATSEEAAAAAEELSSQAEMLKNMVGKFRLRQCNPAVKTETQQHQEKLKKPQEQPVEDPPEELLDEPRAEIQDGPRKEKPEEPQEERPDEPAISPGDEYSGIADEEDPPEEEANLIDEA